MRLLKRPAAAAPLPADAGGYEAFAEQLPDAFVLCDAEGRSIRYANQEALKLCGATRADEVVGQPLAAFMHPDEQEAMAAAMAAFVASGRAAGQTRRLHLIQLDGTVRLVETIGAQMVLRGIPYVSLTMWDVTLRERSEAHTAYLASFPQLTPIPTLEVEPSGQVVYANPAAHEAFPGLGTEEHALFKHLPAFRRALDRGAGFIETRVQVDARTFEARLYSVPGSENLRIYAQDVTLQQEALLGLSESREKFSRVFLSSPVPLVVVRVRDGVFVDLNDAFVRLVGAESRDQLMGRTPMDAGFWRTSNERRQRLMLFRELPIEGRLTTMRRLDTGEERRVELWADRIVVAGEACWAGVFLDVEAHLSAEEALQAERDFVQSLLDVLGEGVVLADAEDRFAYVNPTFERLIGIDADTLQGQPIVERVDPDDRARYSDETARRQAGEASSYELCFLHADGTPKPVLVTGVPIRAGRYAGGVAAVVTDLSALKAAQAEMQQQKEYYEDILNRLPLQLATFDSEARYRYVNPAALPDPDRRKWIIGHTSPEYAERYGVPTEILAERHRHEQEAMQQRQTVQWIETLHTSGGVRHFDRVVTPVIDAEGQFRFAIAYGAEVTERIESERRLRALKEFYESILEHLPLRVMVFDSEGRLAFANAEVVPDEGLRARVLGKPVVSAMRAAGLSNAAATRLLDHFREARETGAVQTWDEQAEQDGEPRHLLFAVRPLEDPSASYVGYAIDVTEQRRADARTEEVKLFYERVLDTLPLEVAAMDAQGRFRYLNPAALRDDDLRQTMIGRDSVEYATLRGLDPEPYERRQAWLMQIVDSREQASLEETISPPGKPSRTILRVARPFLDAASEVSFLVGYALDITERYAYEQGLVAAREQAEDLARLKSSFLANMSHEIRTPLAGIIGFAEVLEEELEGAQREAASLVRESGMRLLDTLNSVLDLARLEAEATELQLAPRDLADELHAAARLFSPTATRKGLAFDVRLPEIGAPLVARIDSAAFHRVLANLISNALKFTETGGIALEARREDDHLVVQVRDTGAGMSAAFLPHVFDEFRQESSGLTRTHQGSGLGLAITKRLVGLMHGTISVESTPGAGSTFTVRLPEAAERL